MQTFTPIEYLKIDVANLQGFDKLTWNERLDWFKENEPRLEMLTGEADKPAQYYAAVMAYRKAIKGEVNYHPIALDATSSGTQLLSCLVCDEQSAKLCNVLNAGKRVDLYTLLYQELLNRVGGNKNITRDMVKRGIMCSLYGSEQLPKEIFGNHVYDFYKLMEEECTLIWSLNKFFVNAWNPNISQYGWVMPDNFHVRVKVYNTHSNEFCFAGSNFEYMTKVNEPMDKGRALSPNSVHSLDSLIVREITALAMHNPQQIKAIREEKLGRTSDRNQEMVETLVKHYQASNFLSARVLDYLDEETIKLVPTEPLEELLLLVPAEPFEVICCHDSYHVLPNYGNELRMLYIAQLAKIARSNLLQYILDQLLTIKVKVTKGNPNMWKEVLASEYALS